MPVPPQSPSLDASVAASTGDRRKQHWARVWSALSVFLSLIGICATVWQPDVLAALSLIPVWCWLVAGAAAGILARRLRPRRWLVALALLWIAFAVGCVEECRSLGRSVWSSWSVSKHIDADHRRLRVVSLNCADGSLRTAREVVALHPDIVLLQESPGREDLDRLATELFGNSHGVLWSSDTSIIARWPIQRPVVQDHFVTGLVQLPSGVQLRVVSLRLAPPVVRYDLWHPSCWRDQTAKRQEHAKQIDQLLESLIHETEGAAVLGGDFNAAQHDRATWPLRNFARDTFDVAGCGWGNTVLNAIPVLRFDQIWVGGSCRPTATWAVRSQHSDHRLVTSDLELTDKSQ